MKKYFLMVVAAIMATMSMNAQEKGDVNYIIRLGGSMSVFANNDDSKYEPNYNDALGVNYMLTDKLALGFELQTNYMGGKSKKLDERVTLLYTSFPLFAKYYVTPWLALQAGPEVSFLRTAKIDGSKYFNNRKVKDDMKTVDFAIPLGLSFEPKINDSGEALLIDLRYHLGLTPVNKKHDGDKSAYNRAFVLTIGLRTNF